MIRAILDTNIIVQSLIASPRSASVRTLEAYYGGRFRLVYSSATLDEILEVLMLPSMRKRHSLSDSELLEFIGSLLVAADRFSGAMPVGADVPRDLTDTKLLSLAGESNADYLVTNDRRHLLRLKRYGETAIVTPAAFVRELG